jgi:hypothetical protein
MNPCRLNRAISSAENDNGAIPENWNGFDALSPAVRDLADLLADIAFQRLKTINQPHSEGPGDVS